MGDHAPGFPVAFPTPLGCPGSRSAWIRSTPGLPLGDEILLRPLHRQGNTTRNPTWGDAPLSTTRSTVALDETPTTSTRPTTRSPSLR